MIRTLYLNTINHSVDWILVIITLVSLTSEVILLTIVSLMSPHWALMNITLGIWPPQKMLSAGQLGFFPCTDLTYPGMNLTLYIRSTTNPRRAKHKLIMFRKKHIFRILNPRRDHPPRQWARPLFPIKIDTKGCLFFNQDTPKPLVRRICASLIPLQILEHLFTMWTVQSHRPNKLSLLCRGIALNTKTLPIDITKPRHLLHRFFRSDPSKNSTFSKKIWLFWALKKNTYCLWNFPRISWSYQDCPDRLALNLF